MLTIFDLSARQATLTFLLSAAFREVVPHTKLIVEHSFTDGYFCHLENWAPITPLSLFVFQNPWCATCSAKAIS